jgi:hypothetical protein
MRRQALIGVLGVGALVVLLVLPSAVVAKKGKKLVFGASQSVEFQLKGSKGYSISVSGHHGRVTLTADSKDASVFYATKGFVSPMRIKARFGRLGRVDVRFHPHGSPRQVPPPGGGCRGKAGTVDSGTWVGRIEFEGEQAYTAVHATRARGTVTKSPKLTCSQHEDEEGNSSDFQLTILSASSNARAVFSTAFQITSKTHPELDSTSFGASLLEAHGRGFSIVRFIYAEAKSDAFTSIEENGHITSTTIAPPAPFKGTATFQRTRGSKGSWTGTLAGDFPGRGEVTLAGPEFSAEVSRASG